MQKTLFFIIYFLFFSNYSFSEESPSNFFFRLIDEIKEANSFHPSNNAIDWSSFYSDLSPSLRADLKCSSPLQLKQRFLEFQNNPGDIIKRLVDNKISNNNIGGFDLSAVGAVFSSKAGDELKKRLNIELSNIKKTDFKVVDIKQLGPSKTRLEISATKKDSSPKYGKVDLIKNNNSWLLLVPAKELETELSSYTSIISH